MDFDRGAVQTHIFHVNGQDLFRLETGKDPVQDPGLAPAVHPGVDGMPIAKVFGQTPPFAAMLDHVQQRIEQLQIGHPDVATLARQAIGNPLKLAFG